MQCVNCEFENIAGVQRCVRCQSIVDLEGVDVWPPRAGPYRMGSRVRRLWNPIGQGISSPMPGSSQRPAIRVLWRPVVWSMIPGLGHIRYDEKGLGWLLLVCWLACLLLMLLTVGWVANWVVVGAAILIHALAMLSFLSGQLTGSVAVTRVLLAMPLFAALCGFVYCPAGGLVQKLRGSCSAGKTSACLVVKESAGSLCEDDVGGAVCAASQSLG